MSVAAARYNIMSFQDGVLLDAAPAGGAAYRDPLSRPGQQLVRHTPHGASSGDEPAAGSAAEKEMTYSINNIANRFIVDSTTNVS